ncbi:hypothetical protein PENSPDRAFT_689735 [Peniophora sp. CONT]|nr:hypothetical protein PENSPDRAFT_689735 [Peniophora sp. CONT]
MAPKKATTEGAEKPVRKTKSSGGGPKKKLSPFNKYMKKELARLKEDKPDMTHKERFTLATQNWKTAKEEK